MSEIVKKAMGKITGENRQRVKQQAEALTLVTPSTKTKTDAMKIEQVPLSKLTPNPDNPREITEEKFTKLKQSIKEFPEMMEMRPIVVDENHTIIGGNMRYEALKVLKWTKAPVVQVKGLTEAQKKEFVIKDNASFGEWDWDALANDWDTNELQDWGLDVWNPSFEPNTDPDSDEIEAENKPQNPESHLRKVVCPHCAESFDIKN